MISMALAALLLAAPTDTTRVFAMPPHGEALFAGLDTLSLEALEREALVRNPSYAAMRAAAAAARARARAAGSLEDPMASVTAAPRSFSGDAMMGPGYRWGVRQRLPVFGERGLERRSARADAAAMLLDAEAARLDLLAMVRSSFFDLYRAERALETNAEQARLVNQFRRAALARYASGMEGQQDPLQADAELGMLAHEEAVLIRERRLARLRLNALLHREPALPLPPPPARLVLPALADTSRRELAARAPWPELRAAEARIEAGEAMATLASRRRLPMLELGFERDFFMREPEFRTMAMLGFNLPIFRGRLAAAEAEARASLNRARLERAAVADEVALRIEEARADYEEALHEMEVVEQILLPTRERALAAARAGYESGRGGFLALLDAARGRSSARLALEEARARAAHGWAAMQRAVAGDVISMRPAGGSAVPAPAVPGTDRNTDRKESQR